MSEGLAGESDASPAEIAEYYNTWATEGYDDDVTGWGYEAPTRVAMQIAEHVHAHPGAVLDAGCGTGQVGIALATLGVKDLVGGDFTPAMVEAARATAVYGSVEHLDLNVHLGFDDDQFSAVVSVGVFSYLTDTASTITELLRITRPGGIVIFTQRTDLWDERECDAIIESFVSAAACTAVMSEPSPYLPGHNEFGNKIGIIYSTLTVA